ncbi:hypothetical protein OH76DRAFT_361682 [Lentinus brumalis]|uniref:Uncharacterized protein n=1 Tax=Lentinus brumalis TaxID=2498619 RepID=A0A371DDZ4_9APHY|nr:hypothetical protein OH76DRAFT_361682 [Polyporus brumalis]
MYVLSLTVLYIHISWRPWTSLNCSLPCTRRRLCTHAGTDTPQERKEEKKMNCTITPGILSARDQSVLSYRKRPAPNGATEPCRADPPTASWVPRLEPSPLPTRHLHSPFPALNRDPHANASQVIVLVLSGSIIKGESRMVIKECVYMCRARVAESK